MLEVACLEWAAVDYRQRSAVDGRVHVRGLLSEGRRQSHRVMMVRPIMPAPVSVSEPCCHDCKESRKNADGCVQQQYPGTEERDASGPAARGAF
eukprot:10714679-Alexandrium_andersonii.AAC.1